MKKKILMACAALVVSAAAVLGVKAYNYYSMSPLMRANLEALSDEEQPIRTDSCYINIGMAYGQVPELLYFCHEKTCDTLMYKCIELPVHGVKGKIDKCQKR